MIKTVLQGDFYTAVDPRSVAYHAQALIVIDQSGMIERIIESTDADYQTSRQVAQAKDQLVEVPKGQVILPGFIDLHLHAPQWSQAGLALDKPLANWLNDYTFPLEAKYRGLAYAKQVYPDLVQNLLANGTTTVLFFGTIHNPANLVLAQACMDHGLRALIGRVAMDNPEQTPDYYRDASSQVALQATEDFIQQLTALGQGQALAPIPVITPRFVPSCTPTTLQGLGKLATQYDLPIQSHLSESDWEHHYAIEHYGHHDANVLDHFGLLTDRAVMAHATQLTLTDEQLVADRHTAIAHCPISNAYFGNGTLATRRLMDRGIKLGLGSDISGGYSVSLYDNLRQAVTVSQMRTDGVTNQDQGEADARISIRNAFYLATVGGGQSLHLPIGQIAPGFQADLQLVQERPLAPSDPIERLERLLYQTQSNHIKAVMVNGDFVKV